MPILVISSLPVDTVEAPFSPASFLPTPLIRLGASHHSTFSHKGRRWRRASSSPRPVFTVWPLSKNTPHSRGVVGKRGAWPCLPNFIYVAQLPRPAGVCRPVDRSRAPLHVHSMDNDARMIRLPERSIGASPGNAGPSDALGGRGNRIHAGRSPPPYRSPVRNRFPQGRWTDYARGAGYVNKSGAKNLLAGFYAIDPQHFIFANEPRWRWILFT